jgi:DNA-binding CsgD family transcriptional regulator
MADVTVPAGVASAGPVDGLLAHSMETVARLIQAPVALGFAVDGRDAVENIIVRGAHPADVRAVAPLVDRLPALEPIDPFSPRRAAACGVAIMSPADAGGDKAVAASMYGRLLRRHGYAPPVVMYFWHGARIESGIALLRCTDAGPFDGRTVRLLRQLQPFFEAALTITASRRREPAHACTSRHLTAREGDVAALVAQGLTNADIAHALGITQATVKTHLTHVYVKLGVRTRTQLALLLPRFFPAAPLPHVEEMPTEVVHG